MSVHTSTRVHAITGLVVGQAALLFALTRTTPRAWVLAAAAAAGLSLLLALAWAGTERTRLHWAATGVAGLGTLAPMIHPLGAMAQVGVVVSVLGLLVFMEVGDLARRVPGTDLDPRVIQATRRRLWLALLATTALVALIGSFPTLLGPLLPASVGRSLELASAWGVALLAVTISMALIGVARLLRDRAERRLAAQGP